MRFIEHISVVGLHTGEAGCNKHLGKSTKSTNERCACNAPVSEADEFLLWVKSKVD